MDNNYQGRDVCCDGFVSLLTNADDRGFSVIIGKNDVDKKYELEFKSLLETDMNKFVPLVRNSAEVTNAGLTNVSLSGRIRINFCPFCGNRLC